MLTLKKLKFLLMVFSLNFLYLICHSQETRTSFCGKIKVEEPFLTPNSSASNQLSQMILCRHQKLYFRTSLGLFSVSSIDYTRQTLTISHPSFSASDNYVSPSILSAGFPSPPQPNSLFLYNCSNTTNYANSCSNLTAYATPYKSENRYFYPCLVVNDVEKLEKGFHPKDWSCSHYRRVYKSCRNDVQGYELGTRISFEIPDHVPNICDECEKSNGNCGIGLKCICHPQECKDRVISEGGSLKSNNGYILLFVVHLLVVLLCC